MATLLVATPVEGALRAPDLVAGVPRLSPAAFQAGDKIVVRQSVRNVGRGAATPSETRFLLSRDARRDRHDVTLTGRARVRRLAGGRRAGLKVELRIPGSTAAGRYRLLACVDARRRVREARERNNCAASRPFEVRSGVAGAPPPHTSPPPHAPQATPAQAPAVLPEGPLPNLLDEFLQADGLSLSGVSATGFNPVDAVLEYRIAGTSFVTDPAETVLTVNDVPVPSTALALTPEAITATGVLQDGRNRLHLTTVDAVGRPVYHQATIWAGSATLHVDLVNEDGSPFASEATVKAALADDQAVATEQTSSTGAVEFHDVPSSTVLIHASAPGNLRGSVGVTGGQGTTQVEMLGLGAPSSVDNNDFSQGTAGWEVGAAPVQIIPHDEGASASPTSLRRATRQTRSGSQSPRRTTPAPDPVTRESSTTTGPRARLTAPIVDNDLALNTADEGEQSISRTFQTDPDVTAVRVRFRFVTSEVPGGYFGSQYNDYFRVSLRSQQAGKSEQEANSMNGLGLAAFDAGGATAWRNVTLPVDIDGDSIRVDLAVANVADGLLDSQIVVDFVEEIRVRIVPMLQWNNTQGGLDLRYRVEGGELPEAKDIEVFFANGSAYGNRLGTAVFTHSVAAGTAEGTYGPVRIPGNGLDADPAGTTHLLAVYKESNVGAVGDVAVGFGPNANAAVVWPQMIDVVKDGLRAAGQQNATITSTARTPADQARAMFNNLTNPNNPIATNVQNQLDLYGAGGDAVIQVFVTETQGMTPQEIQQDAADIRAAMEQEIVDQGPQNVSRHTADPAVRSVVDVGAGVFNANNDDLFVGAVQGRVTTFLDERNSNNCFHLEIQ